MQERFIAGRKKTALADSFHLLKAVSMEGESVCKQSTRRQGLVRSGVT